MPRGEEREIWKARRGKKNIKSSSREGVRELILCLMYTCDVPGTPCGVVGSCDLPEHHGRSQSIDNRLGKTTWSSWAPNTKTRHTVPQHLTPNPVTAQHTLDKTVPGHRGQHLHT